MALGAASIALNLLVLKPNTTQELTDQMAVGAREVAAASTGIVTATTPRGMPHIATRAEAAIGGVVALKMLSEMH
jgi:allantoin racemase